MVPMQPGALILVLQTEDRTSNMVKPIINKHHHGLCKILRELLFTIKYIYVYIVGIRYTMVYHIVMDILHWAQTANENVQASTGWLVGLDSIDWG